jgi:hypothetical protein
MGCMRCTMSPASRNAVERQWQTAQPLGQLRQVTYGRARLAVMDGQRFAHVALILRVQEQTSAAWGGACGCYGLPGAPHTKPPGRPPTRTPTPTEALATLIEAGPVKAGCRGAGGRSPMLPQLIADRCGGYANVFSSAPLLTN